MKYKVETSKNNDKVTLTLKQEDGDTLDKDQLQHLIDFVEEFKNYMDFQHITDLLKFVLLPLLQDKEKRNRFINVLEAARIQEESEIAERLQEDSEAFLSSIPHSGLDLIKNTLADFQTLNKQERKQQNIQNNTTNIPIVTVKPIDKVEYPLDKPNSIIWNLLEVAEEIAFATEKHTSKKEATVIYSINFDELENEIAISKKLTPFDKRIYMAVSALFNGGNEIVSITQILSKMGMTGKPSKQDVTKTLESLKKMLAAHIHIDNILEHKTYKNYPQFKYDGILLPIEIVSAYINGQLTESAVHIFREPPMITFAKERRQITTIPTHLLESPVSKTDQNLIIDNYLIERISRAKRGKTNKVKILYATIFENCNITTVKQKQRAPEKIERYLTHYIKCGFITRYNKIIDGIEIHY